MEWLQDKLTFWVVPGNSAAGPHMLPNSTAKNTKRYVSGTRYQVRVTSVDVSQILLQIIRRRNFLKDCCFFVGIRLECLR